MIGKLSGNFEGFSQWHAACVSALEMNRQIHTFRHCHRPFCFANIATLESLEHAIIYFNEVFMVAHEIVVV